MCGIAGIAGEKRPDRIDVLRRMGVALARRGPDEQQVYEESTFGIVFRRLSIVDLSAGSQPIWNENRTLVIAVNGEIYNHRELRGALRRSHSFRTSSDSEIVLHLFEERGPACLELLNGMFAMAIWEPARKRLFLARDRLGIRPLSYCDLGQEFVFASELKAILTHPDAPSALEWPDLEVVPTEDTPLRGETTEAPTFVKGVKQLAPGHFMWIEDGRPRKPECYWSAIEQHQRAELGELRSTDDAVESYRAVFLDSVRLRLMADVPIGIFLSGGIDSSALAMAAGKQMGGLECFHIAERGIVQAGETERARTLAQFLGQRFHPVRFDLDDLGGPVAFDLSTLEYLVWVMDSPRFSQEWFIKHELHRYVKTAVPNLKVILLGQGADEFAGGYTGRAADSSRPGPGQWEDLALPLLRTNLLERRGVPRNLWELAAVEVDSHCEDARRQARAAEIRTFVGSLAYHNLWHEDRSAAAQGVESRVPFLDHRLVELLVRLPYPLWEELLRNKTIIRRAVAPLLGDLAFSTPKIGLYWGTKSSRRIFASMDRLLRRVWPAFRAKYVGHTDSVFRAFTLDALFEEATAGGPTEPRAVALLVHLMCISIFERQCRRLRYDEAPAGGSRPSPLQLLDERTEAEWLARASDPARYFSASDVPTLAEGALVARASCKPGDPAIFFLIAGGRLLSRLQLDADSAPLEDILLKLTQLRRADTVAQIAAELEIDLGDLLVALDRLASQGWVRRLHSEELDTATS